MDATNIIENPSLSVITSISLDHTQILGDTTEQITREKAGIIEPNSPVVIGPTVAEQIINEFVTNKELLYAVKEDRNLNFDEENILIAKKCIHVLSERDSSLRQSIQDIDIDDVLLVKPKCRFEVIEYSESTHCIMDCVHNLCGVQHLFQLLINYYDPLVYDYRVALGMSRGKNVDLCLQIIAEYAKYIHFVSVSNLNKRSLTVDELNEYYEKYCHQYKNKIMDIPSDLQETDCQDIIQYALDECMQYNEAGDNDKKQVLIVCGSVYIMSNARQVFGCNDIIDPFDFSNVEFGARKI